MAVEASTRICACPAIESSATNGSAVSEGGIDKSALPSLYHDSAFWGMTATQLFGAFNDNLFKNALVILIAYRSMSLLGISSSTIVVASILLAIVICLSMFYFFGVSVNFITISGLTVCFGMLLDNSILVLDAIHRRLTGRNGKNARKSLIAGSHEVAFPILATTFTTVVAFLSFIFMTDRLSLFYVPLAVSVPSHCLLMQPAADAMAEVLRDTEIRTPTIPVLHNVSASTAGDGQAIREALVQQLWQPVRWSETIQRLVDDGVERFAECGPGKVLAGLVKRIDKQATLYNIHDPTTLDAAAEALADPGGDTGMRYLNAT